MKYSVALFLFSVIVFTSCSTEERKDNNLPKVVIESELPTDGDIEIFSLPSNKDFKELQWTFLDRIALHHDWYSATPVIKKGKARYVIHAERPLLLQSAFIKSGIYVTPGDSIGMGYKESGFYCQGKGAESIKLQYELDQIKKLKEKPTKACSFIYSLDDYFKWKAYLDNRVIKSLAILDKYENKVPESTWKFIKVNEICNIERERSETFLALYFQQTKIPKFTIDNLVMICDTTLNGSWINWLEQQSGDILDPWCFYQLNKIKVMRKYRFNMESDSLNSADKRKVAYYNSIKQSFQGVLRERLLQYYVATDMIKKQGLDNPITISLLTDYYKQDGFPEYKQWMKEYENKMKLKFNGRSKI